MTNNHAEVLKMKKRNIILVILIIVIAILGVSIAMTSMPSENAQKNCHLTITSNSSLYEGGNLTVKLSDMDGNGISNQTINITITAQDGTADNNTLITNSSGIGILELDNPAGNYTINCNYAGNENYTSNSTSQNLEIKQKSIETASQQSTQETSSSNDITYDEKLNVYYDNNGIVVDPDGEHPMEVGRPYSDLVERQERWENGELEM